MPKPYHHGNLRVALLDSAIELIAQKGPHGFTLAEAAKMAGVSAAAPYRHFPSKDDLVRAIADQGFSEFANALKTARLSDEDPLTALINMGRAYLKFAHEHKGEYIAMFESGLSLNLESEKRPSSVAAFAELLVGSEAIARTIQTTTKPNMGEIAQHIWALSHGVASLFARNSPDPKAVENAMIILENGVRTYLNGLAD